MQNDYTPVESSVIPSLVTPETPPVQSPPPDIPPVQPYVPPAYYTPRPRRVYTAADRTLAWLCWLLGYLFWRLVTPSQSGAGVLAFAAVFTAVQVWFLVRGGGVRRRGWWTMLLPLLFAVPFLLFGSGLLLHLDMVFLVFAGVMGIYYTYETARGNASDALRGLITRPFGSFGVGAGALVSRSETPKKHRGVLLGLLIALPLTVVVGALLVQADAAFAKLTDTLLRPLDGWGEEVLLLVPRLVIAIPVALYLFGAFYSCARRPAAGAIADESWHSARQSVRCVAPTVLLAAGIPLCALYALFFVSQTAYYFSAFTGYLPADFTYAEYARQGFFQLCVVALINLAVLLFVRVFARRGEERLPVSLRVYSTVLCGFTLLLIATALRKMVLYIEHYGLTPLRVYTSWFMVLLAAVFLILAITQFFRRSHAWAATAAAFLVLFAVLQFGNVNGWIARYNVEQYRTGALPSVDVGLFDELGDAAVPYAAELLTDADEDTAQNAKWFLRRQERSWEKETWITFNLENHRARQTVAQLHKSGALTLQSEGYI